MDHRPYQVGVAIPRLERRDSSYRTSRSSIKRITTACADCRNRKVRCSGETPKCQNCINLSLVCTYPQARKDRLKNASKHVAELVSLVKDLSIQVDDEGRQRIVEMLGQLGEDSPTSNVSTKRPSAWLDQTKSFTEESLDIDSDMDEPHSMDSAGDLGTVDEDLFRDRESRATGFIGHASPVHWFRSIQSDIGGYCLTDPTNRRSSTHVVDVEQRRRTSLVSTIHISDSSFYLDGESIGLEDTALLDPWELPPPRRASVLFNSYMQTFHHSFPLLPDSFATDFHKQNEFRFPVADSWAAMSNLIFAIGAQHAQFAQSEPHSDVNEHVLYMTRAVKLMGFDEIITTLEALSLAEIQAMALLSLYFLTAGHANRAWMVIGISLRSAIALGLHLRNDDPSIFDVTKETMKRTWWTLKSVESVLCAMLGRPGVITSNQCTVSLPRLPSPDFPRRNSATQSHGSDGPVAEGAHVEGNVRNDLLTSWRVSAEISIILEKTMTGLYSPQASHTPWKEMQKKMVTLSDELEERLATALSTRRDSVQSSQGYHIQGKASLLLAFQYQSAKLLIYRPCISQLIHRIGEGPSGLDDFDREATKNCLEAAHAIADLFPDQPNLAFIYQRSPWWSVVHYIMQALAVFLLEILSRPVDATHTGGIAHTSISKLLRWLKYMGVSNETARRAYNMTTRIIVTSVSRLRIDISDILEEGERGYSYPFLVNDWVASEALAPSGIIEAVSEPAGFGGQFHGVPWAPEGADLFEGFVPDAYTLGGEGSGYPLLGDPGIG